MLRTKFNRENGEDRENRDDRAMIPSPHQPYQPYQASAPLSTLSSFSVTHQALAPPSIPAPAHLNQHTISREKGCRCNARQKSRRWAVQEVLLIVGTLFASGGRCALTTRNISCQKGLDLAYRKSEHPRIVLKRTASGAQLFGISRR